MAKTKTRKIKVPKKMGRPRLEIATVFPENWKDLVEQMSDLGYSESMIRVELCKIKGKFSRDLWFDLVKRDADFSDTLQRCKVLRQAWWERQAVENLKAQNFQTGLWYACMKNMFGWRDKQEVEHSGEVVHHYEVKKQDLEDRGEIIKAFDLKASAN